MDSQKTSQHLSQIATLWTVLREAHGDSLGGVAAAQQRLVERYSSAIYRYLLGAVRDPDVAADLFQEFALRFVRGDFKAVDPERGRFRDYLKAVLYRLIVDHHRRQQRRAAPLPEEGPEAAPDAPAAEGDEAFLAAWRTELLSRAWQELDQHERETGQPLHTVLRLRTDHPELRSPEMAARLAGVLGRPVTSGWVRKRLFLARDKLADLVLDEVARSLDNPSFDDLAQELIDLGLLEYCRPALERRGSTK
jgi:RNA polymerase sigma-70 factor (ECF subfamily)